MTVVHDDLRPLLFSIAYRMLGSVAEAEDVVQEAYLRRASAADQVESERAYMTTVTTRLAIDVLRSARVRRETYVGEWLPEPLVEPEAPAAVEAEESVSLAMLVLLERLNPVERAVFVLRESFDVPFDQIAAIVDRSRGQLPPDPLARPPPGRRGAAALRRRPRRAPHAGRPLPRRRPRGRPRGPRRRAGPGRGPDRRRRRRRALDPAPDARRARHRPRARRVLRPDRRARRHACSPSGSTASRASAPWTPTGASSTSSASTSSAAASPRSTRSSTRPSSHTSARRRTSACGLVKQRARADVHVAAVIVRA